MRIRPQRGVGLIVAAACLWLAAAPSPARPEDSPGPAHFVIFGYERERIREAAFLEAPAIAGAQLKYSWRELEPEKGRYDFAAIHRDLRFLRRHGKRLFVQVQDVSFVPTVVPVPAYLVEEPAYSGGAAQKLVPGDGGVRSDGWVARRWDPAVRERFTRLLAALAGELDGRLEGVNLPETAVDFGEDGELAPADFSPEAYARAILDQMSSLARHFRASRTIQYANFMPGEWLPWTDRGLLQAVHDHAAAVGVGVGGPDLLPHRRGQQSHSLPLIASRAESVVAGLAVQDGNLSELDPRTGEPVSPRELERYAREELRLDYLFWGAEEPHFGERVLPFLKSLAAPAEGREPAGRRIDAEGRPRDADEPGLPRAPGGG